MVYTNTLEIQDFGNILPELPNTREIVNVCLRKAFNNPAVQYVSDYLINDGKLATFRDLFIPVFEASENIRGKIGELAEWVGIKTKSRLDLHSPRRTVSQDSVTFQEDYISENLEGDEQWPSQLDVILCNPSRYRDDGKVRRHKLGFLPQGANEVLEASTPNTIDGIPVKVAELDDKVDGGIQISEIVKHAQKNPERKTVVCLTSVQTNQFDRALDIALELKLIALELGLNIEILLGGAHIRAYEPSFERLSQLGIVPVNGEIEQGRFSKILSDAMHGKLQRSYSFTKIKDFSDSPFPPPTNRDNYASRMLLLQASRGCPRNCNFCSLTKIEGRKMRYKPIEEAEARYRAAIDRGDPSVFITDDNFFRNKNCRKTLEMMARIREEKDSKIKIMFQSELSVVNRDGEIDEEFMDLCQRAGVFMIFFGQESFNPEVLSNMDKKQNLRHIARYKGVKIDELTEKDVEDFTQMFIEKWRERGVAVNYTCIVGLKGDKPGCGKRMAERAIRLGADFISPYVFTLLPGSKNYEDYVTSPDADENRKKEGIKIVNISFNNADSVHPNLEFEDGLTAEEQTKEFLDILRTFYQTSRINKSWDPSTLGYYLLHCLAAALGEHPMSLGISRVETTEKAFTSIERLNLEKAIRAKL